MSIYASTAIQEMHPGDVFKTTRFDQDDLTLVGYAVYPQGTQVWATGPYGETQGIGFAAGPLRLQRLVEHRRSGDVFG